MSFNEKCEVCTESCKQESFVTMIACKHFVNKETGEKIITSQIKKVKQDIEPVIDLEVIDEVERVAQEFLDKASLPITKKKYKKRIKRK
jgi:hypothetical protein